MRVVFDTNVLISALLFRGNLEQAFVVGQVREAVECPTFVYADYGNPKKRVSHYLREYKIGEVIRYTKVVLERRRNGWIVVTAYRPDYVKERDKTKLVYGSDDNN